MKSAMLNTVLDVVINMKGIIKKLLNGIQNQLQIKMAVLNTILDFVIIMKLV